MPLACTTRSQLQVIGAHQGGQPSPQLAMSRASCILAHADVARNKTALYAAPVPGMASGVRALLGMCGYSATSIGLAVSLDVCGRFDEELEATLNEAPVAETVAEAQDWSGNVQLYYHTQEHFEALAKALGLMKEWRDGVPRAAYKGVVSWQWSLACRCGSR